MMNIWSMLAQVEVKYLFSFYVTLNMDANIHVKQFSAID